ncbi:FecR domain-containing protein [Gimesia aquarii]|uniref:FecR protein n=1 Tax=Gimesia aquarii TaxID=2527964 RepID=A0A517VQS8_9PLAN|nr:FecR family protein [Gimesia aquarii]QDT95343.1 FecR protein [Gimesia aquarii]
MITESSTNWEDPLPKLVALYFDNKLNEKELRILQTRLKSDLEARVFFAQFSALQTQLEWVYTDSTVPQEMMHLPASIQSKRWNWSHVMYIATCICLVLGGLLFIHLTTPVAHVFPITDSLWKTGPVEQKETLFSGSTRYLLRGAIEIQFESGSVISLKAPASFTTNGKNAVYLDQGKLVADIPESGHGFEVETLAGRIVDLGTSFSVNVIENQNTEINVFRGKVVVGDVNSSSIQEIKTNEAIQIDSLTKKIVTRPYSSSDFIPLISRDYPVLNFSKSIIFQEKIPDSVASGSFQVIERDNHIFLFPETRNVKLHSDLNVSISQPGRYWSYEQIEKETDLIPRGTQVDCYRLYYDPASDDEENLIPTEGEIEFDQPVLGLITTKKLLIQSDSQFNPLLIKNPQRMINHQEIEIRLVEDGKTQDIVTLSPDRKKLSVKLFTGTAYVDELRVLVSAP